MYLELSCELLELSCELLELSCRLLCSTSSDFNIKIRNKTSANVIYTLTGHTNYIYGLAELYPGIIASGSLDSSIKIITSGTELKIVKNYQDYAIYSLIKLLDGSITISSSTDNMIKIWSKYFKFINLIKFNLL